MSAHKKSDTQHKLEGTYRAHDHGDPSMDMEVEVVLLVPPPWISEIAQNEFRRMAAVVNKQRIITDNDEHLLIQYAILWNKMYESERPRTEDEGPAPKFAAPDHAQLRMTGAELGSGAISRARIKVLSKKASIPNRTKANLGKVSGWGDV